MVNIIAWQKTALLLFLTTIRQVAAWSERYRKLNC